MTMQAETLPKTHPFQAEVLQSSRGHGVSDCCITATKRDDQGSGLEA